LVYKLVIENLKHRPVRTLLSALAIGLGVTMMLTLVGLGEGMMADQQKRARGVGADIVIRPPGSSVIGLSSAPINEKLLDYVRAQKHVTLATGTVIHSLGGVSTITGVDFEELEAMSGGFDFRSGRTLDTGSALHILNGDWRVAGVFRGGKLARLMVGKKVLQEATSNTGKISVIYVKLDNPAHTKEVIAALKKDLVDYPIYSMEELVSQFSVSNVPELTTFIGVVVTLSVLFGFLVVFLAMYTAVLERTREIGILKALGADAMYILGILMRETALLALLGSAMGILMSYGTRWLIATFIPASMVQAIVYSWWPIASGVTLVGAILGVLYPAVRAARQDALESLSYD
jgi:putative ABC transport system permease protein